MRIAFLFTRIHQSRMTDSFLGTGSVELKESILTKNDKHKVCRGPLGLFKYIQKGRERSIGTDE